MLEPSLIEIFTQPLEKNKIDYLVTGSVASLIYGEPRLTHDVDLILDLKTRELDLFMASFPLSEFYCPPSETILLELKRESRAHFNLIHHQTGFKADCYLRGRDLLHDWAFRNKKSVQLSPGIFMTVAPPEYVILRKLEYYREGQSEKHLKDIASMLKISAEQIDTDFIGATAQARGLGSEWALARQMD